MPHCRRISSSGSITGGFIRTIPQTWQVAAPSAAHFCHYGHPHAACHCGYAGHWGRGIIAIPCKENETSLSLLQFGSSALLSVQGIDAPFPPNAGFRLPVFSDSAAQKPLVNSDLL